MSIESTAQAATTTKYLPKKSARSSLRIPSADLRLVAPYLFIRQDRRRTQERASKQRSIRLQDFSLDVAHIESLPQRLYKTGRVLCNLTESTDVKLYLLDRARNEIYFCSADERVTQRNRVSLKIESGKTITAYVAWAKESVMTNDLYSDDRYPDGIHWGDMNVTSVICVPVLSRDQECSVVIELFRDNGIDYEERDLDIVTVVGGWMGSAIEQHQNSVQEEKKKDINTSLMKMIEKFISDSTTFGTGVADLLHSAKTAISAQRGTLYLLNGNTGELETEVYDEALFSLANGSVQKKLRRKLTAVAALAVNTNHILNIEDAYKDPRFDKQIDLKSGFLTRSVLCKPIANAQGCTGVLQLINKMPTGRFDSTDEEILHIFGSYCSIMVNLQQAFDARAKATNLCTIYDDIVTRMVNKETLVVLDQTTVVDTMDLLNYSWHPYPKRMHELTQLTLFMLNDLFDESILETATTLRFIRTVQQHYQQVAFHNFEHAFVFTHCVYYTLKLYPTQFDMVEKLSLMVGGLCHDLDHPGYSNTFIRLSNHPLSVLYDEPFLENHHCWMGQLLLQKSNLLQKLSIEQHRKFMEYFRQNIMATDLNAHLLQNRIEIENILEHCTTINWSIDRHRCLVRGLIMTAADLCGQSKPFVVSERMVNNLYIEFYRQGDKEKAKGLNPLPIMDRAQAHRLAEFQIDFIRIVCMPCFKLLQTTMPLTEQLHTNSITLKSSWMELIEARGVRTWNPDVSIGLKISDDEDSDSDSETI